MTEEGMALIKRYEGLRLEAYRCPAGVWTIGYGHTQGVREGDRMTRAEAERLLKEDLLYYDNSVAMMVTKELTAHQTDALVSLAYNIGVAALRRSTLLRMVNRDPGDPKIGGEFGRWAYAGGRRIDGLARRRKAEAELYYG